MIQGIAGPMGSKGVRGPRGEPGKCTFSNTCGIENAREKIIDIAEDMYEISKSCLENPSIKYCDNDDIVAKAVMVNKQINVLEDMAAKTTMAEKDFMDKLNICLSDPSACNIDE